MAASYNIRPEENSYQGMFSIDLLARYEAGWPPGDPIK